MKTREQIKKESFDKIKLNDKCLELLSKLQDVVNEMNPNYWNDADITENYLYKDKEGDVMENFWENMEHWIDNNETYLINNSKFEYKNLTS